MAQYLPAYAEANNVDGKVVALPAFADAMFLYYRKDLLEKHGVQPPQTWDELTAAPRRSGGRERPRTFRGCPSRASRSRARSAPSSCPTGAWAASCLTTASCLRQGCGRKSLALWKRLVDQGVAKKNIAEVATDDTRKEFQAGNVLFAVNWSYAWGPVPGTPTRR